VENGLEDYKNYLKEDDNEDEDNAEIAETDDNAFIEDIVRDMLDRVE